MRLSAMCDVRGKRGDVRCGMYYAERPESSNQLRRQSGDAIGIIHRSALTKGRVNQHRYEFGGGEMGFEGLVGRGYGLYVFSELQGAINTNCRGPDCFRQIHS